MRESFGEDLLSFLPEIEVKREDNQVHVYLQINIRVAPFTPKIINEKMIVERAANAFFTVIEEEQQQE
ncbi:MAG: hypothetical protein GWO20_19935 [Candidatus Korarchaeota archaeon]|nr:hypothetical protein [Candidatus Korarchaeota archaeon]NIU85503.1 hypothetical protein [Candidatus Thorarchaeota archaeon]NIW53551.1 hypothetical protein [Candidatus Korarchaeota archaeon]